MKKKRVVNNGPYIRNANLIGNGPKASPVDGSYVKGIELQRSKEKALSAHAIDKLAQNAEKSQSYNETVNRVRKLTP